jgi:phosphatidylglycerol:prolipoprotein diacylglycerol transferase
MLYSLERFFLEMLRGDYVNLALGLLKSAQMTSVIAFIIALAVFLGLQWKGTTDTSSPS